MKNKDTNKYNLFSRTEKWIIQHSFVCIWFPLCGIWEILLCFVWFTLLVLGCTIILLLSWDGHLNKNLDWYTDKLTPFYLHSSVLITKLAEVG